MLDKTEKRFDQTGAAAYECHEAKPMMNLATLPPVVHSPRPFPAIRPGEGVNIEMKKKLAQFMEGIVKVSEHRTPMKGRCYYELRYVDPDSGMEARRRVHSLDLDEIKDMAQNLTRRAYHGKGYLASKAPSIEDGILHAIQISRGGDYFKANMTQAAKPFLLFMAENYPAVKTWADLRPGMVETYIRQCERRELAWDSIRLRLVPVKAAWKRMHADYPELVKAPPALKLAAPPRREIVCLEAVEVARLLDWLKIHKQDLWPMACLQGLAGLRVLEAAALRTQDVDLEARTVTVMDTGRHKPKTRDSYRTIPVCDEVMEALKVALAGQKVRPAGGEIFTNMAGNLWGLQVLSYRWGFTLQRAALALDMPRLAQIPTHRLRASFATMASKAGAQDRILKAYLGHTSGDILGGHYRRIELDELRLVSGVMNGWREAIKAADARKESGNIPLMAIANH